MALWSLKILRIRRKRELITPCASSIEIAYATEAAYEVMLIYLLFTLVTFNLHTNMGYAKLVAPKKQNNRSRGIVLHRNQKASFV